MRRKLLAVLLILPLSAACSSLLGDFSTGPGSGSDASSDTASDTKMHHPEGGSEGGGPEGSVTLKAVATSHNVWLSETATVDGTMSTASSGSLTYSWDFTGVPATSTITKSSLADATAATTTFTPDVAGTYELELTVTEGKASSNAKVSVVAAAGQVFYDKSVELNDSGILNQDGGGGISAYWVADYDGTHMRQVTCGYPMRNDPHLGLPAGFLPLFSANLLDTYEGEAGDPVGFAGFSLEIYDAGDSGVTLPMRTHLLLGTAGTSCKTSPPIDLGEYLATMTGEANFAYGPRFNKDGTQIAFHDQNMNIITFAATGGAPTVVSDYFNGDGAGNSLSYFDSNGGFGLPFIPRPTWNGTNVMWARPTGPTGWEVAMAPNKSGAPVSVYMSCTGIVPREIQYLADGTIMTAHRAASSGPVTITLYKTDSMAQCTVVRSYSSLSDSSVAVATAFDISPDEKQIAFTSFDPAMEDASLFGGSITVGFLYVAPVNGSSPPVRITNDPVIYGPRWIAGGTRLAFTTLPIDFDANAPPPIKIAAISPESGAETTVEQTDGVTATAVLSSALGCSTSARPAGASALAILSLGFVVRLVRRRRQSS